MFICSASPADGTQVNGNERTTEFFRINLYQAWRGRGGVSPPPSCIIISQASKKIRKGSGGRSILQFPQPVPITGTWTAQRSPPIHAETPNLQKSQRQWKHNTIYEEVMVFAQVPMSPVLSSQHAVNSSAAEERFQALDPTKCISNPTPANCRVRTILTPFTGISELPPPPLPRKYLGHYNVEPFSRKWRTLNKSVSDCSDFRIALKCQGCSPTSTWTC